MYFMQLSKKKHLVLSGEENKQTKSSSLPKMDSEETQVLLGEQ